jgi:hypothetical protein
LVKFFASWFVCVVVKIIVIYSNVILFNEYIKRLDKN